MTTTFETTRLHLREFIISDGPDVFAYHSTSAYQRFYPQGESTPAQSQALVNLFVEWQQEMPRWRFQWAVTRKGGDALIGNCGIRKSTPDATEAEIGCELAPQYWGRNYPLEMGVFLLRFGFETLSLQRIYAQCLAQNRGAVSMCQKLGMMPESLSTQNLDTAAEEQNRLVFEIFRDKWKSEDYNQAHEIT